MLDASVFRDDAERADLLAREWALRVDSITPVPTGTANCQRIACRGERFLLKEFQASMPPAQVQRERRILAHLAGDGIPVSRILRTRSGADFAVHRGRLIQLQAHLPGGPIPKHEAPGWLLEELAALLGRIARSLAALPSLPDGCAPWIARNLPERARRFRSLAVELEAAEWLGDAERAALCASALARAEMIDAISSWRPPAAEFRAGNTHGDYSIVQVLCAGGAITGVVDFASACRLPYVWEAIRSFTYAHPGSRRGGFDAAAFQDYLAGFESILPLAAFDRIRAPALYLYQLAPSLYGFRELAAGPTPNQDERIEFACWRTDLCRTLLAISGDGIGFGGRRCGLD